MHKIKLLFFFLIVFLSGQALTACKDKGTDPPAEEKIPAKTGYKLVWNDEFNSSKIDLTKWEYEVNGQGGGNNELQYYTARDTNSYIKNGVLVIQALKETFEGPDGRRLYTSARMRTKNKGDWTYCRIEVKAKLPYGQGLWPAIWMLPTDWQYGGWPLSGEIDIMELLGHEPNKVYGTLHYGKAWPNNSHTGTSYTLTSGTFAGDFHVFSLEWEKGEMRWYVDEVLYLTQKTWFTEAAPFPAPFDKNFHLLLNVAVGGNWPGSPDIATTFPQKMEVDYVRVFKKITE